MFNIDIKDEKVNKYDISSDFIEGFASVTDRNNLMGFVNLKGEQITDIKYASTRSFSNGLAAVQDKETELWGFIDTTGKEVIPCMFEYAFDFTKDGICNVCIGEKGVGYINTKGEFIFEPIYDDVYVSDFSEGYATVTDTVLGKAHYINTKGEFVGSKYYDICLSMQNGVAYARNGNLLYKLNNKLECEIVSSSDELGINISQCSISRVNDKIIYLEDDNRGMFLDENFKCIHKGFDILFCEHTNSSFSIVHPLNDQLTYYTFTYEDGSFTKCPESIKYDQFDECREGYITMCHPLPRIGAVEYIVDKNWNMIFDTKDQKRLKTYISEGLFVTSVDDLYGYENAKGEEVIPHIYKFASGFKNGFAVVDKIDGSQAVIDKEGNEVFVVPHITKTTINVGDKQVSFYSDNDMDLAFNKMEALRELEKQVKEEVSSAFSKKFRDEQTKAVENAKKLGQMKLQ